MTYYQHIFLNKLGFVAHRINSSHKTFELTGFDLLCRQTEGCQFYALSNRARPRETEAYVSQWHRYRVNAELRNIA